MSDIKVRATAPGFDGIGYRKAGDVFTVDQAMFSDTWMAVELDTPVQDMSQEAQKAKRENAVSAVQAFGEALAVAGADPVATAQAVATEAPAPMTEAQAAKAEAAERKATAKAQAAAEAARGETVDAEAAAKVAEAAKDVIDAATEAVKNAPKK